MNEKNISFILRVMEKEGRKRDAPIFKFKKKSNTPFETLVSAMLSSRTKDEMTGKAVSKLFKKANTPSKIARMNVKNLEKILYGVGFYKTKARNLKKLAKRIVTEFKGRVPQKMEELVSLPGVGRKTANIVLCFGFRKKALPVDVHVHRISNRLGLVKTRKPEDTERVLLEKIPGRYIRKLNFVFVSYGQTVCLPLSPLCSECRLNGICPKTGVKFKR